MTEPENPAYQEPTEGNFIRAPLQIRREGIYRTEEALSPSISAVAVIRPPTGIGQRDMTAFYSRLIDTGILPIAQYNNMNPIDQTDIYFPTDQYREVEGRVLIPYSYGSRSLALQDLYSVLEASNDTRPLVLDIKTKEKPVGVYFAGANYVYDEHSKLLIYDNTEFSRNEEDAVSLREQSIATDTLDDLCDEGWNIIPLDTHALTINGENKDLDFIVSSPFKGKTGGTYMFVAQPLQERVVSNDVLRQTGIQFLPVPEGEVLKGGCNIADLNRSSVLVCANHDDAPIVFSQLTDLAEAKIVEAPRGFLDEGGGPRCSISSISIR